MSLCTWLPKEMYYSKINCTENFKRSFINFHYFLSIQGRSQDWWGGVSKFVLANVSDGGPTVHQMSMLLLGRGGGRATKKKLNTPRIYLPSCVVWKEEWIGRSVDVRPKVGTVGILQRASDSSTKLTVTGVVISGVFNMSILVEHRLKQTWAVNIACTTERRHSTKHLLVAIHSSRPSIRHGGWNAP